VVRVAEKRRTIVYGKLRVELGRVLRGVCEYKGVEVVEGSLCTEHIHMGLSIFGVNDLWVFKGQEWHDYV
jgi:REP element-mobilizing transposase RayT